MFLLLLVIKLFLDKFMAVSEHLSTPFILIPWHKRIISTGHVPSLQSLFAIPEKRETYVACWGFLVFKTRLPLCNVLSVSPHPSIIKTWSRTRHVRKERIGGTRTEYELYADLNFLK